MERLPPARRNLRAFAKTLAAAGRGGWLASETLDVGRRGRDEIGTRPRRRRARGRGPTRSLAKNIGAG